MSDSDTDEQLGDVSHRDAASEESSQCRGPLGMGADADDTDAFFDVEEGASASALSDLQSDGSDSGTCELNEVAALQLRARRQAQTVKARAASLVSRTLQKHECNFLPQPHPAQQYRHFLQPRAAASKGVSGELAAHTARKQRLRVLLSWLHQWCAALANFLRKTDQEPAGSSSLIDIVVVDDTNVRLAETIPGAPHWMPSRVVTMMNMVQHLIVGFAASETPNCEKSFIVHTPFACLGKADQQNLGSELRSRVFLFLGELSPRFRILDCAADVGSSAAKVPIQALAMCFDSLPTNLAVLKHFRSAVRKKHLQEGHRQIFPVFAVCCVIHKLALIRKPLLLGFAGFWSTLVRLGHLFEAHSFRAQMRTAIIQVVCQSFKYVPTASLPVETRMWRDQRNQCCNLGSGTSVRRMCLHQALAQWDNGDTSSVDITHYCNGSCCLGTNLKEREQYALLQVCKHYILLFANGFAVPLLYRWKHAQDALQYVKDSQLRVALALAFILQTCVLRSGYPTCSFFGNDVCSARLSESCDPAVLVSGKLLPTPSTSTCFGLHVAGQACEARTFLRDRCLVDSC